MIDKASVKDLLVGLAGKIRKIDKDASVRLMELSEAVEGNTHTRTWANTDTNQIINADVIVEQYAEKALFIPGLLLGGLELLRNILIFTPIMITWYSISQATGAYHQLLSQCLNKCPDQVTQPFLYLWEQGFGGRLPEWLKLSSIGIIDAFILLVIFTLTLVVSPVSAGINRWRERDAQRLHAHLVDALAWANFYLHEQTSPLTGIAPSPSRSLDDVVKRIEAMSVGILGQFNGLEKKFGDVATKLSTQFGDVTTKMSTQFNDMTTEITKQFGGVATDLSSQFQTIQDNITKQLEESDKHISKLGTLVDGANTLGGQMKIAADQLQTAGEEVSDKLNLLLKPVENLATQQGSLLTAANESVTHLKDAAQEISKIGRIQKDWTDQIMDALEPLHDVTGKFDTITNNLNNVSKQLDSFLDALEEEREGQGRLAERLADASQNVKEALDAINNGATSIRSISVDMSDILTMQASMSNPNSMDVSAVIDGYTNAAQIIGESARNLEKSSLALGESAGLIFDAGQTLKDAVDNMKNGSN